ncbi:redoxin domain-containing protein (plasmid) [Pseudalkalibacillus hwajinpoensis]|uniref:TlpA family protein disulfide reductase n=1 Tax=Guptibacillus hwajinpoensis TaxID=208199 RepID=UPI00325C2C04
MKKFFLIFGISLVVFILGAGIWAYNNPQAAIELVFDMGGIEEGEDMPVISGREVEHGTASIDEYLGNEFVVMIGRVDCDVCKESYQTLEKLDKNFPETPFVMIGEGEQTEYAKVKKNHNFTFPIISASEDIKKEMNFKTFPVFYLVDEEGKVAQRLNGYDKKQLEDLLGDAS